MEAAVPAPVAQERRQEPPAHNAFGFPSFSWGGNPSREHAAAAATPAQAAPEPANMPPQVVDFAAAKRELEQGGDAASAPQPEGAPVASSHDNGYLTGIDFGLKAKEDAATELHAPLPEHPARAAPQLKFNAAAANNPYLMGTGLVPDAPVVEKKAPVEKTYSALDFNSEMSKVEFQLPSFSAAPVQAAPAPALRATPPVAHKSSNSFADSIGMSGLFKGFGRPRTAAMQEEVDFSSSKQAEATMKATQRLVKASRVDDVSLMNKWLHNDDASSKSDGSAPAKGSWSAAFNAPTNPYLVDLQ